MNQNILICYRLWKMKVDSWKSYFPENSLVFLSGNIRMHLMGPVLAISAPLHPLFIPAHSPSYVHAPTILPTATVNIFITPPPPPPGGTI